MRIVVVAFESVARVRHYLENSSLPWPVLVDDTRYLYCAYGMATGRFRDIWGPATWWAYLKELVRGRVPGRSDADVLQLGGDVLVQPSGIVQWLHVGKGPADRPSVDAILSARNAPPAPLRP